MADNTEQVSQELQDLDIVRIKSQINQYKSINVIIYLYRFSSFSE